MARTHVGVTIDGVMGTCSISTIIIFLVSFALVWRILKDFRWWVKTDGVVAYDQVFSVACWSFFSFIVARGCFNLAFFPLSFFCSPSL
ncbi:hypothetical protein PDE_04517 [Penicillium oxalicum 114-2]|uniref:Uncharacterized protein n=1 Tax=Penicillium oxalicum (strain 114-2 / CGMCC 5302) TaxID=933388 RepID=S8B4R6_PENO1|nr:hypothetical protein PDE_04517 [Penicillium oxalicum 114-2]